MSPKSFERPLSQVKVLDLTRLLPGPYCSMLLVQLGAEVIKIEKPNEGDPTRRLAPLSGAEGVIFHLLNRGKKSLTLDLRMPEGQTIFRQLAARSDVILEGFRPGVAHQFGVDYDSAREVNPRIVYCSLSGYGQRSPRAQRAGHDVNYIGLSGVLGLTADTRGQPVIPVVQIADLGGALFGAISIIAALYGRGERGEGGYIDVSLRDAASALLPVAWSYFLGSGDLSLGDPLPLTGAYACYNIYRTADDHFLSLGALEPKFWRNFCVTINREDLIDRQFDGGDDARALKEEVAEIFSHKTRAEWLRILGQTDACCEPVLSLSEMFSQEVRGAGARGRESGESNAAVDEGNSDRLDSSAPQAIDLVLGRFLNPFRFTDNTPAPGPSLGQHNEELLLTFGYSMQQIADLCSRGVI